jgi:hypothetical protein
MPESIWEKIYLVADRGEGVFDKFSDEVAGLVHGLRALVGSCEVCGCPDGVELEGPCTAYPWDGEGSNPNRRRQLCRPCAKEHYEFWDEMWRTEREGRL